jgi:hypothetical protein
LFACRALRVTVEERARTLRVQPLAGTAMLECVIEDGTGALSVVFVGSPRIAGMDVGTRLRVEGTAAEHHGRLAVLTRCTGGCPTGTEVMPT